MVRRQSLFLVFSLGTNVKPATRDHFYSICTSINATQDQGIAYYTIKRPHRKNIWQFVGMSFVLWTMDPWNTIQHMPWNTTSFAKRHSQPMQTYHFSFLQVLELGQSGGDGQSATHLGQVATSSDLAIATMLPRLLPAMVIQLRWLHAHQSPPINHSARMPPTQVDFLLNIRVH